MSENQVIKPLSENDFTLSFLSVCRPEELENTLLLVQDHPNVQVILNGVRLQDYSGVIERFSPQVRFIVNRWNLGIAAGWNQSIVLSNTRYVILSSDHMVFDPGWFGPLLRIMDREDAPLQVGLSYPRPACFSTFCIDKRLIPLQGWFDHNFTLGFYEDEDWYLRFRERLGLYNHIETKAEEIIPSVKVVLRPSYRKESWNIVPNYLYFHWKWKKARLSEAKCLYARNLEPFKRRLSEPEWPLMDAARSAYARGDFGEQPWTYSPPRPIMRLVRMTIGRILKIPDPRKQ